MNVLGYVDGQVKWCVHAWFKMNHAYDEAYEVKLMKIKLIFASILATVPLLSSASSWISVVSEDGNYRAATTTEQDEIFAIDFSASNCDQYYIAISIPNTSGTKGFVPNAGTMRITIKGETWKTPFSVSSTPTRVWTVTNLLVDSDLMKAILGGNSARIVAESPLTSESGVSLLELSGAVSALSNSYNQCKNGSGLKRRF